MPIRSVPKSWEGAGAPKLILENRPDKPVVLSRPITFIGQRRDAHLRLAVPGVSSLHAVIAVDSSGAWIYDLSSRTGTIVNGQKVAESPVRSEDTIQIGSATLHFVDSRPGISNGTHPISYSFEMNDGGSQKVSGRFFSIGRRPGSSWRLESPDVSLTHAVVCQLDGKLYLRDAGSRHGTHLNGLRVSLVQILPTDLFAIGSMRFRIVQSTAEQPASATQIQDEPVAATHDARSAAAAKPSQIDDLSPELLDSLFGEGEASGAASVANQAMHDTGSVDWGILKSAVPTIRASDPAAGEADSNPHQR